MNLRGYQTKALEAVFTEWQTVKSTAVVMATALGKTILFAHVARRKYEETHKRILVIAHRKELIEQARDKIVRAVGLDCDIEMGKQYASSDFFKRTPVVIATVQTLNSGDPKRMERFDPDDFSLVVCDEFHHGTSKSYRKVFDWFKRNPNLRILGVTATPDRADEEALSQICDSVAFHYDILDGVNDGWLVPVTQQFCPVSSLDFSHVRTTAGDLNEGDLARIMEAEENVQGICHPSLEVLYGLEPKTLSKLPVPEWPKYIESLGKSPRRGIVFTVSVAQSQACANILNRVVPGIAEWVCGETPTKEREAMLARFHEGKTAVMVNCGVLTEGFDCPPVEVIFMARPTKSRSLYTQMVGRATRTLPSLVDGVESTEERQQAIANSPKPRCRIIDFAGNSGRHKLICALDILGGKCSPEVVEKAIEKAKEEGKPVTVLRALTAAEAAIEDERKRKAEEMRLREEARKARIVAKSNFSCRDVDPFGQQPNFEPWQKHSPEIGYRSKDGRRFSDRQLHIFRAESIDPSQFSYRQAQAIIGKLLKKPSTAQRVWLTKKGYDVTHFDRDMAHIIMDAWAQNGWRRPPNEAELLGG